MIDTQKLFDNYFDDAHIIPSRLDNFAGSVLNNLTSANTNGDYTALIALLSPVLKVFKAELGNVDTASTVKKGATLTNDQVMVDFKATIRREEPFIARAVGGKKTALYLQFFPNRITEYTRANKTTMPVLVNRVYVAATTNSALLDPTLANTLQGFKTSWQNSRDEQQQKSGVVGDNRAGRTDARTSVELALMQVIGAIMQKFPGNVAQCSSFFNFNQLFPQNKAGNPIYTNSLAADQTVTVLNHNFTGNSKITVRNTVDNAPFVIWLAASEKDSSPSNALQIKPGKKANIKLSDLGDLQHPFLLIKNLSGVNAGGYEVTVK